MEAVCSLSGGMDSSTLAGVTKSKGYGISALHRNYGQRIEGTELVCAKKIASLLVAGASCLTDSRMIVDAFNPERQHIPNRYVPCRKEAFAAAGIRDPTECGV
ncbi:7-cyano-7-deazaguanine synthase [Methanoregula sp.]|uniref:7-cyano-7-deazaguanine synthase n=1 Tax=Methanoregula sp. TaxID=2052170 RepID=UPI00236AC05A|nr:7-cyano-7-deazaguanine synthase [Methanoregula sp.]MDD1687647.1 7-cyano-7-deazaguanine synthase [Methanoregula sp.]